MARAFTSIDTSKLYEKWVGPLFLAFGISYLVFHALSGELGIYALLKEERKLTVLQNELDSVEAQRKDLDQNVRDLSPASLDLDLLDERARAMLGVSGENEIVIPLTPQGVSPK